MVVPTDLGQQEAPVARATRSPRTCLPSPICIGHAWLAWQPEECHLGRCNGTEEQSSSRSHHIESHKSHLLAVVVWSQNATQGIQGLYL
jgi:hypothetical protein